MKKIGALFLVLSAVSFAGYQEVNAKFNQLESQYSQLVNLENQEFAKLKANAENAAQKLESYSQMRAKIDERIAQIEAVTDSSIFSKEFKTKVSEYKALRNQLDKEIARQQQIIDNFEISKSLR